MEANSYAFLAAGLGVMGATFAGAFGISQIAKASVESIARQPEAFDNIRFVMIISAAMIEGAAFFGLIISIILSLKS
jgi:F-type H+-transporting ATPase subunit c